MAEALPPLPNTKMTDTPQSTDTSDSKGCMKWKGLKNHIEKLLKEEDDTLQISTGFEEFEKRVGLKHIQAGYIIYMARTLEDTTGGQKLDSVDPFGLLTDLIKKTTLDRKYIFSHVAIYVGCREETHYFVENGGHKSGQKFLSNENRKKGYTSAIQLIDAKKVIGSSPFIAMTVPWGKLFEPEEGKGKKQKLWPTQEEVLQKALASVGFPFKYNKRSRSCETFTLLLLGIGDNETKDLFPQLEIVLEDASWISQRYAGSPEVTEKDLIKVKEFQQDLKKWFDDLGQRIDRCEFKVEGGEVLPDFTCLHW